MSDVMIWLGNFLIAVGVVMLIALVAFWWVLKRINARLDDQIQDLLKQAEDSLIGIEVEVDNNQYFFYNSKDKSFICQGVTAEQLKQGFISRCPNKNAYFASGDERAIEYLSQEFARLKEQDEVSHSQ